MTKWISKVIPILISFVPRQLLGKKEDSFLRLENVKLFVSITYFSEIYITLVAINRRGDTQM